MDAQTHRISLVFFSAKRTAATTTESIRATVIVIIVEFHITRTVTGKRSRAGHETAQGPVSASIRQKFPVVFAAHFLAELVYGHIAIGFVAKPYVSQHIFVVDSLTGIQFAVAEIEGKTQTEFRQEVSIFQYATGDCPQERKMRQYFVIQVKIHKPAVILIAMDIIVAIGAQELEIPTERNAKQVWRTHIEGILVILEERIRRSTILHLGSDVFAQYIEVCEREADHQPITVRFLPSR